MNGLRFAGIELKNWKNFKIASVELADRVFIIGPNAIGKSNLLDAFRFLRDLAVEGGGLYQAVNLRGGMSKLRCVFARQDQEVEIVATLAGPAKAGWRYTLGFTHLSVRDSTPVVTREIVDKILSDGTLQRVLTRPNEKDQADVELRQQTAIQQVQINRDFRELVAFFRSVSCLHIVPQLLREPSKAEVDALGGSDPWGRDLLNRINKTPPRRRNERLGRIQEILEAITPLDHLTLRTDSHGLPHLEAKLKNWRPRGVLQNEAQFSDGTLRMIGFLWALQEGGGPLLLEEPELSLHTQIVRRLAPFIFRAQKYDHGRQVILSTHSEVMLSDEGIAPAEVVLIQQSSEGSDVVGAATQPKIVQLMQKGIPASEAALPLTTSPQMELFDRLQP